MYRLLNFAHVNPFYLLLLIGYGLTRLMEWLVETKELWSTLWNFIAPNFVQQKFLSYILGLPLCVIMIHWGYASIMFIYEITRKSHKRPDPEYQMSVRDWLRLAIVILLNQLIILPSSMILNLYFLKFANESHVIDFVTIPSFSRMFYRLFVSMIMYEIINFYVHWMLHHPLIYKQVYKPNYQIIKSHGVVNVIQYPIEYILLSVLPPSLAMSVSRCDAVTIVFFLSAIVMGPFFENYALQLPFLGSNGNHLYTFKYCNDCCRTNGMVDFIHETYGTYFKTKSFENHRISLSMKFTEKKADENY